MRASLAFSERVAPEVHDGGGDLDGEVDDDDAFAVVASAAPLRACHSQLRRSTGTTKMSTALRAEEEEEEAEGIREQGEEERKKKEY